MKSRVFVSCGQHTPEERLVARSVCKLLADRGFSAYLAIDVQTILDINGGIIRELKNSDCYLLVNFQRDQIGLDGKANPQFRGSLFSNQELAIAYALQFEKILIVNQTGVVSEGMLRYIGVNTETFGSHVDCAGVIDRALKRAGWLPTYSRRLGAGHIRFGNRLLTYGKLAGWFLYLDVHNFRPDIAAREATARLAAYKNPGEDFVPSFVRSPLKATSRPGFSHTIFPQSHEAFDMLCIGVDLTVASNANWVGQFMTPTASGQFYRAVGPECQVHLNSALDVMWTSPLPVKAGVCTFRYEIFAVDFPVLMADIEVDVPDKFPLKPPNARVVAQELS
jgi:hypothetical protein